MITFTQKDTIEGFQIFIEQFEFRETTYNFYLLMKLYLKWLNYDIENGYEQNEKEQVRTLIKKHLFSYFRTLDFSVQYNKEEILEIIFH